jgi:hypothetical protein
MPSITATVQGTGAFVSLDLVGTGPVDVYRQEPKGDVLLRGSPFTLSGGLGLAFDYEAPFDTPITYRMDDGADYYSSSVTVPSGGIDWLRSLSSPYLSSPVEVTSFPEKAAQGNVSLYQIIGKRLPIAAVDVMGAFTGTLSMYVEGEGVDTMIAALADGYPMLLHSPPEHGEDRLYFVVNDYKVTRVSDLASDPGRIIALSIIEVDASRTVYGVSPVSYTWDTLDDDYATWAQVAAAYQTWNQVVQAGLTLPGT